MSKNIQVVIIDQDVEKRRELQKTLALAGLAVVGTAGYGIEAYGLCRRLEPDVVLLRVEEPTTRPLDTLNRLSEGMPHLPVAVYSSKKDPRLMRQAMTAGAEDFLQAPLKSSETVAALQDAVRRAERRKARLAGELDEPDKLGTVITVFGAKGGIGKTTIATSLACALSSATQANVAVVDMDTSFGDVAVSMDLEPERTIAELARNIDQVDREQVADYLVRHSSGVDVLAAPNRPAQWRSLSASQVNRVVGLLAQTHDFVVIDTPGAFNEIVAAVIEAGSVLLLVTTTELAAIKDSLTALETLRERFKDDPDRIKVVLNRYQNGSGVKDADLEASLAASLFWRIPEDKRIAKAMQAGSPVVVTSPKSKGAMAINDMALSLAGLRPARAAKRHRPLATRLLRRPA